MQTLVESETPSNIVFGSFHHYDTTNLYIIKPEINKSLQHIEQSFTTFAESIEAGKAEDNIEIISDAILQMQEIKGALDFLKLHGARELAVSLIDLLNTFTTTLNNTPTLYLDLFAEGLMLLSRYCEFVLLREAVVPHLLLPITNTIRLNLKQPVIREGDFLAARLQAAILTLPSQPPNIMPEEDRAALLQQLRPLFQHGLLGVLSKTPSVNHFKALERAVFYAYMLTGNTPQELFWHTAYCAVQNLEDSYPISDSRKRVLIAIEQQLKDIDIPTENSVFIDVLAMGLCRDNPSAKDLREQLALSAQITTDLYAKQLRGYIFGPTSNTIFTTCQLVFEHIAHIKEMFSETPINQDTEEENTAIDYISISYNIRALAHTLKLLGLNSVTTDLLTQANIVELLESEPTEAQVNHIVLSLLHAENAISRLEKSYTPGAVLMPVHNMNISQFQLDQSYIALIQECKQSLQSVMNTIEVSSNVDSTIDMGALEQASLTLITTSGGMNFLQMPRAEKILKNTATYAKLHLEQYPNINHSALERLATIISSIDYHLDGLLAKTPTGDRPFTLAETCLSELHAERQAA